MTQAASAFELVSPRASRGPIEVCHLIDELPASETGELVLSDGDGRIRGVVFVQGGRVCWAAAHGLAPRLTELLVAQSGIDRGKMQELFAECQQGRLPLGEQLVSRGFVSAAQLGIALSEHTIESMTAFCRTETSVRFRARCGGYNPRFTLSTSDIVTLLCARERNAAFSHDYAPLQLFSKTSDNEWGALFSRDGRIAFPVPIATRGRTPERARELLRYGQWAASALDVASAVSAPDAFISARRPDGTFLVAWPADGEFVVGCMTGQGPARVLHHRAADLRARAQRGL